MRPFYACGGVDHSIARRQFLGGMAAAGLGTMVGGLKAFTRPAAAAEMARQQKRIVVFNMHGGLSQLESWDPSRAPPRAARSAPFPPACRESISVSCCR
jgi:hypothetical protein